MEKLSDFPARFLIYCVTLSLARPVNLVAADKRVPDNLSDALWFLASLRFVVEAFLAQWF